MLAICETKAASGDGDALLIERLDGFMANASDPELCLVAQLLGYISAPASTPLLAKLLRQADPDIRIDAARSVAKTGDASVRDLLSENLHIDPVGEAKVEYVKTLQVLGVSGVLPSLVKLIAGRSEDAEIAWEEDVLDWDDWLDVQVAAIEAASGLAAEDQFDDVVQAILAALNDPEGQDLWPVATFALARLGSPGCVALGRLCDGAPPLNRRRIAAALSKSTDPSVAGMLAHLCRDESAAVRIAAIRAAASHGHFELCEAGLDDLLPEVRVQTLSALPHPSKAQIAKALNDANDDVRIAACRIIENTGKKYAGLSLAGRAERSLRRGSPGLISAFIGAMAASEPADAAIFVADVINHPATKPEVRRSCIRCLVRLKPAETVSMLGIAAGDGRQDIRLEAIAALGKIAEGDSAHASAATGVLISAITGSLIEMPADYVPESDNVTEFIPKKGRNEEDEKSGKQIKLDRDGNLIDPIPAVQQEEAVADEPDIAPPAPSSTLDAILAVNPKESGSRSSIELDSEDIAFLELTPSRAGKRKLNPEKVPVAHLDVRRLAARIAGETGRAELVVALAEATASRDEELCDACLAALAKLGAANADIGPAEDALLRQAAAANQSHRARAIEALAWVSGKQSASVIDAAVKDAPENLRVCAVTAAACREDVPIDLPALMKDKDRGVRLAAARAFAGDMDDEMGGDAVAQLLDFAVAEDAVHLQQASQMMRPFRSEAILALLDWLDCDDAKKRLVALQIMAALTK